MKLIFYNLTMLMFLLSCFMFSFFYKHILMALISLEFMMVNTFYNIFLNMLKMEMNMYFMALFLAICVCESVVGLSLMINLVNLSGNDYSKSLNLLKC